MNTVLGITAYKKARYEEAEKYLRKAIERLTDNYTSPKDGEAIYYLGLTLKAQRKDDEALRRPLQIDLEFRVESCRLLRTC